jgi:predicted RNase H-like HicB family nuclease
VASLRYTVILEPEEGGGYHAFCPALKGLHTCGDTFEETIANAKEAVQFYIESLQMENEPISPEDYLITWVEANL